MAIIKEIVSSNFFSGYPHSHERSGQSLERAQQYIFNYLLQVVKTLPPAVVLEEFSHLFIDHSATTSHKGLSSLQVILLANNEQEFRNTIKRCCYILVNNWEMSRQHGAIQELVELFKNPCIYRRSLSPTLKRLRQWLVNFIDSPDYQQLELFALRLNEERTINQADSWAARYTPYLLVPQYINESNPVEQRQAAKAMAQRLKEKFKFDLAMYTAYAESPRPHQAPGNPTELGDGALRLIKAVVAKQGVFSYRNLARLFLAQVKSLNYGSFKRSLVEYLLYIVKANPLANQIKTELEATLDGLYSEYDLAPIDQSLVLRTCDRIIDTLMTEDRRTPTFLFTKLLAQQSSVTLAIILLKLVLISPNSHAYLEARIADLITYYEQFPPEDCQWIIHFLEVFRVIFTLYTENVEYSLVQITDQHANPNVVSSDEFKSFRIFSQTSSSLKTDESVNGSLPGQSADLEADSDRLEEP